MRVKKSKNEASSQPITAERWKADHDAEVKAEEDGPKAAIKRPKPLKKSKNEASSQPITAERWKADQDALLVPTLKPLIVLKKVRRSR